MKHPSLSVLIPAAGASERLGRPKQLVRNRGRSLLQGAIDLAHSLSPLQITVVTGAHAATIKDSLHDDSVSWVHNPDWSEGMGGSIAVGVPAINPAATGLMILLCDQWRIEERDLETLVQTWETDPTRIVVSEAGGEFMPPVIFPAAYFEQLRNLQGDQGARSLFGKFSDRLTPVHVNNAAFDLDTPNQLDELLQDA